MDYPKTELTEMLHYIDPALLSYQEWINVGMGLKEAGYTVGDWKQWSARDSKRYHPGECERKWNSFQGAAHPVTGGTIVQMALARGWEPPRKEGRELAWDDIISADEGLVVVNQDWIEAREVVEPQTWDPVTELVSYLEALFDADDYVGYVTKSYEKDGRHTPSKGCYDRTAGKLIQELGRCGGDVGRVLGDYSPEAGAWIRFNPLDGKGVKNENVTEFRYALVESDSIPVEKQNAIIRELELPVAALVHSGGKSLHAIVRVEAESLQEYRTRVDYLYSVCQKNGLEPDRQNRNPSRRSRLPGVMRGESKQFLAAVNIGKASWDQWKEWIESVNDDLPETESLTDAWQNMPALATPLIDGVLRQGHKLLVAGPSKAGKSFALIELCCCVAEGRPWMGFRCAQGRILYVNLELDRASCLHRFKDVYTALGWEPDYPVLAAEKIAAELKDFSGGQKEKAVSKFAAETVTHFCEESPQFAEVVYRTRRTLSDCCAQVMKGPGNCVSDIDVYRGIVRAHFPNADVKLLMNIEIKGAIPSEEKMAKLPEKTKPRSKPAPKKPAEKAVAPAPAKSAPKKPQEPDVIQLALL